MNPHPRRLRCVDRRRREFASGGSFAASSRFHPVRQGPTVGPASTLDANQGNVPQRLAAILAADAANFSRLVARDQEVTLRSLACRRTSADAAIRARGGRILTTAGERVLAEFAIPPQAVRAGVSMQRARATATPADAQAPLDASGCGELDRLEGDGSLDSRRCALAHARGSSR